MLIKINLFAQAFLLFASTVNALLFYLVYGNESLILTTYVLLFFLQFLVILSFVADILFDKDVNKLPAWIVILIYGTTTLFLGSETDTLLYKFLLSFSLLILAFHVRSKLRKE
jgi:hypothetical protein